MGCKLYTMNKFDFLCPECGEISPEISNINIDKKYVEFKCKLCAEKGYYSKNFYNEESEDGLIFTYFCKPKPPESEQDNKFLFREDKNNNMEFRESKYSSNEDFTEEKLNQSLKTIKEKNEQLKKIITFNNLVIETSEKCQNNYFHLKSLKNISSALKFEKERDQNDLNLLLTSLNYENKFSENAIKKINDFLIDKNENIKIERQNESLLLSSKKIDDELFKYISQIKFNQLKEINLSENKITNIEPLCYMCLPFLEYLNLSNNQIIDIKPLSEINSKYFKYLFIQNNQIEDIQVFLDDNFPTFDILRIENNKIEENNIIELINLYKKKGQILIKNINDIKKYEFEYKENMNELDVSNKEGGDLMLKYIFINIPSNNKIITLKLDNNKIKDPSILNRIEFNFLEELHLNSNNIKNLNFLKGMKAKNLKILYLEENDFKDLTILGKIKKEYLKSLEQIYVGRKDFNNEDPEFKYLKRTLENEGLILDTN